MGNPILCFFPPSWFRSTPSEKQCSVKKKKRKRSPSETFRITFSIKSHFAVHLSSIELMFRLYSGFVRDRVRAVPNRKCRTVFLHCFIWKFIWNGTNLRPISLHNKHAKSNQNRMNFKGIQFFRCSDTFFWKVLENTILKLKHWRHSTCCRRPLRYLRLLSPFRYFAFPHRTVNAQRRKTHTHRATDRFINKVR